MRIWIKTAVADPFMIEISEHEQVSDIKNKIQLKLNNQGVFVPLENLLIFQGRVLTNQIIQEIHENDLLFFIFNLNAKPPSTSTSALRSESTTQTQPANETNKNLQNISQVPSTSSSNDLGKILPPQFAQGLQSLIEMGFSEVRAKRALLHNSLDVESAAEWLVEHSSDPEIDNPITFEEVGQFLLRSLDLNSNSKLMKERVEVALKSNKCTFTVTGRQYVTQTWYHCYTCGLVDSEGCCESCMKVCHKGHKLSAPTSSQFFCDCGSGGSCQAL